MDESQIGASMLQYLSDPFKKMIKQIPKQKTLRVEIVDDGLHTLNKHRVSALKNVGESYGLEYTVHAPFAGINIASPSRPLLNATMKRLKQSIINASMLECRLWIFHPAMKTGISMFYPGMDWARNLESIHNLAQFANTSNVKVAVENVMEPFVMKTVEDFRRFYRESGQNINMVLDTGHAHICGQLESFMTDFSDKIVHIHAHDNDGKSDQHLGIGYGSINWNNFASILRGKTFNGTIIVEAVEHVEQSMDALKRLLG